MSIMDRVFAISVGGVIGPIVALLLDILLGSPIDLWTCIWFGGIPGALSGLLFPGIILKIANLFAEVLPF